MSDDRFEILGELGRGGMAVVYRAYDRAAEQEVALKVLHRHMAGDEEVVDGFLREARLMQSLDHPGVVRVYGTTEWEGRPAFSMEVVEGGDLRQRLASQGPLTEEEALAIVVPLLEVLGAAHDRGILHRDIKPHNVLLDKDGKPRLTDFGIGQAEEWVEVVCDGQVGTVEYMAPERINGVVVDGRSDLYSLAVMTYEMVCGRVPFRGGSAAEVMRQHRDGELPDPGALAPGLSQAFRQALRKGLARFPEDRFDTAEEMGRALTGEEEPSKHLGIHGEWAALVGQVERWEEWTAGEGAPDEWLVYVPPLELQVGGWDVIERFLSAVRRIGAGMDWNLGPSLRTQEPSESGRTNQLMNLQMRMRKTGLVRGLSRAGCDEVMKILEEERIPARFARRFRRGEEGAMDRIDRQMNVWINRYWYVFVAVLMGLVMLLAPVLEAAEAGLNPVAAFPVLSGVTLLVGCVLLGLALVIGTTREHRWDAYMTVYNDSFVLDFRDEPEVGSKEGRVGGREVAAWRSLRSPRIKASYERVVNLALHLDQRFEEKGEEDARRRLWGAVAGATEVAEEIAGLEARIAGVGAGELTSRLREMERQIAGATEMEVLDRLMEERARLRERIHDRDRAQDRIQTLAQGLLTYVARVESAARRGLGTKGGPSVDETLLDFAVEEVVVVESMVEA